MNPKHRSVRRFRAEPKERKRMRKSLATLVPLVAVLALAVAACGGGGNDSGSSKSGAAPNTGAAKKGGSLTVMSIADIDNLDPGYWYYQYDYMALGLPAQRTLYSWKPNDNTPTPDLATGFPQASDDGKTLTIKIKPNIKYSPPLQT